MSKLSRIFCYPIKGFTGQESERVDVTEMQPLPNDRVHALLRPNSDLDCSPPTWAHKSKFVMLMKDEVLAAYTTHLDEATEVLRVYCEGELLLDTDLRNEQGRRRFENFVYEVLGAPEGQAPPKLISAQEPSPTHFMDKPDNVISLINLESVREVSDAIGMELDPMRFRANFYIDNLTAWQEFDWVGSTISIGAATFRVDRRNARCAATDVNPRTAARDIKLPSTLRRLYGHTDLGVYLIATSTATVQIEDSVEPPRSRR